MSAAAESDGELAARLAQRAGRLLLDLRARGELAGQALGDAGDRAAHRLLCAELRAQRPGDGLLSEEGRDDPARLARRRVWIVDPLDGTREYGEGRADWAVHVGLAIGGQPAVGAVALPGLDPGGGEHGTVLRSDRPRALPPAHHPPRIVVSRTRPPRAAAVVAGALGGELVPMGSAGAKAMAVALGQAELYLHAGGQYEWDSMAPVAVALAHGLHCSRLDGSLLCYNRPDLYLPDLLICRPELAARVLELVAALPAE